MRPPPDRVGYNKGDAGHIALELLEGGPPEIEQKCFTARKAIEEGYLSLDEALDAYEIEKSEFVNYLLNIIITNRNQLSSENEPLSEETLKAHSMLLMLLSAAYQSQKNGLVAVAAQIDDLAAPHNAQLLAAGMPDVSRLQAFISLIAAAPLESSK